MRQFEETPVDLPGWAAANPVDHDPSAPDTAPGASMPTRLTPLIGRDDDRDRLRRKLIDEGHRLVVISGPGGIGKTRLAAQVASDLHSHFRHGARFVPLASVAEIADLDHAFAWHLGLREGHDQSYRESIRQHLQFREVLLVIDNVEQLPGIAGLLRFIQERCASVAMLVTTRNTLDIYGEVVHQLLPLAVRANDGLLPGMRTGVTGEGDAIRLFEERVRAVLPEFTVSADNADEIAAICDCLGGIPLAIELTAPRLASAAPGAVLAELQQSLAPDGDASATSPAVSMHNTMRLSYDRLTPDEQRVFRALSVMCGHWTIDDVLPMLAQEVDELDAIGHLDALVTRSMVYSPAESDDDMWFTVNPVLRGFSHALLAALGEDRELADRHAERMVALADEAGSQLTGPRQRRWLARIDALHEDFHIAHEHLLAHGRPDDALRLGASLWRHPYTRGRYREAMALIERALSASTDQGELRARALNGVGLLANVSRDVAGSRAAHHEALGIATRLGLDREIAISRIGLADLDATIDNDTDGALRHLALAADAYERMQDARGIASVLTNRGYIEWQLGELDRAFTTHEEARVLYAQASDTRGVAWSDTNTGRIAAQLGRYHEAVPRLHAGLDGYLELGDVSGVSEVLEGFAAIAVRTGDLATASTLAGAATALRASIGSSLSGLDREQFEATLALARRGADHETAFTRGSELGPDEAIAIARSIPVPAPPAADARPDPRQVAKARFGITKREHQVLLLLGEGLTDHQIADRLGISPRTVQTYTTAISRKLDVSSRVSAVRTAHQARILM